MITFKTYGPTNRGNVRKFLKNDYLITADFAAERYTYGGDEFPFDAIIDYSRASSMKYFDPVSRKWITREEDEPILYAPDGQRGLYLTGALGAVMSGNPTGAGSSTEAYASGHNNKVLPVICWGAPGAEISVSGDFEYIDAGETVSRPFKPLFIRLTGGSLTLSYNDKVTGYKIPQQGWDEWPQSAQLYNLAVGPITGLTSDALADVNELGPVIEFSGKYIPHASRFPIAQSQWALQFGDGTNSFGFYLNSGTNEWTLSASPANARILRPSSKSPAAPELEFRLVWDKVQHLANIWANGRLVNEAVAVPALGPLTELTFGKTASTSDLRATLKYFAVRSTDEKITPWVKP